MAGIECINLYALSYTACSASVARSIDLQADGLSLKGRVGELIGAPAVAHKCATARRAGRLHFVVRDYTHD
jgi:hypothetical protein